MTQIPTELVYNLAGLFGIVCLGVWFIPGIAIKQKRVNELKTKLEEYGKS